jgi:hypothetical protein
MKNSIDNTGNRTQDLLAFSAVPEPTAPSRARHTFSGGRYSNEHRRAVLMNVVGSNIAQNPNLFVLMFVISIWD